MATHKVGFHVDGGEELERMLKTVPQKFAMRGLVIATRKAWAPVQTDIKARIKGMKMKAGAAAEFAKSIAIRQKTYKRTGAAFVVVGAENKKWPSGRNWNNLAHFFEYGTKPHYVKPGVLVKGIPAQPVFRPAFDAKSKDAVRALSSRLKVEIEAAMSRAAVKGAKK